MEKKNKKNLPPFVKLTEETIAKIKPVSPEQQAIINENLVRWEEEDAYRLALKEETEKEIASLGKRAQKLIKKLREAEKTDPKKPILRASADYDPKINERNKL